MLIAALICGCAPVYFKLPPELQNNSAMIPVKKKFFQGNKFEFSSYRAESRTGEKHHYVETHELSEAFDLANIIGELVGLPEEPQVEGEDQAYSFSLQQNGNPLANAECTLEHRYSVSKAFGGTVDPPSLVPLSGHCDIFWPQKNLTQKFHIENKKYASFKWGGRTLHAAFSDETSSKHVKSSNAEGYIFSLGGETLFALNTGFKPVIIAPEVVPVEQMDLIALASAAILFFDDHVDLVESRDCCEHES